MRTSPVPSRLPYPLFDHEVEFRQVRFVGREVLCLLMLVVIDRCSMETLAVALEEKACDLDEEESSSVDHEEASRRTAMRGHTRKMKYSTTLLNRRRPVDLPFVC